MWWQLSREIKEREEISRGWICEHADSIADRVNSNLERASSKLAIGGRGVAWNRILVLQVEANKAVLNANWVISSDVLIWFSATSAIEYIASEITNQLLLIDPQVNELSSNPFDVPIIAYLPSRGELAKDGYIEEAETIIRDLGKKLLRDRGFSRSMLMSIERLYWLGIALEIGKPKYLAWLLWHLITAHGMEYSSTLPYYVNVWEGALKQAAIAPDPYRVPRLEDIPF